MSRAHFHEPHQPNNDVPEEFESGALPVAPDEGPVPAPIPDDPEYERGIDPAATRPRPARRTHHQVEVARCP